MQINQGENRVKSIDKVEKKVNDLEFSIIVVTYNQSYNKLFQTLISILSQENTNFEIIIEPISVACENALACSPAC